MERAIEQLAQNWSYPDTMLVYLGGMVGQKSDIAGYEGGGHFRTSALYSR